MRDGLLKNGYFVGELCDFITNEEYLKFTKYSEDVKYYFKKNKESLVKFRYNYGSDSVNFDSSYPHSISVNEIDERKKLIFDNEYVELQRWYYLNPNDTNLEISKFFEKINNKIVTLFYPNDKIDNVLSPSNFTLFENGDFIEQHVDGFNKNRLCVILIYLSNKSEYSSETGGELILNKTENGPLAISPILGKFVILDFTKNNLEHSVSKVKNNFKRYAYNSFVVSKS